MNKKLIIAAILAIAATAVGLHRPATTPVANQHGSHPSQERRPAGSKASTSFRDDISVLTQQQRVADYLHQHQQLPPLYLKKSDARRQGWDPARGNLCEALPGRAIGGDRFSNREGRLPDGQGRRWFEADVNYQCGRRGSDRMLYSSDGLIYVTRDHYRHFEQVK
ncbi:ribonuclease domain-containing protein [Erwinia sp. ErVv1]|uniref:ribonuclease domain-containing protein n=1 Tax=Erwinia sp. ErVv1 TaxID=1603299 RepID=UPI00082D28FA|nr:ribonuclease domain-containing protein [Erwinia sp. ErVv1]